MGLGARGKGDWEPQSGGTALTLQRAVKTSVLPSFLATKLSHLSNK